MMKTRKLSAQVDDGSFIKKFNFLNVSEDKGKCLNNTKKNFHQFFFFFLMLGLMNKRLHFVKRGNTFGR